MIYQNEVAARMLLTPNQREVVVDMGQILPIGDIEVQGGRAEVTVSLDGSSFSAPQQNETARYARAQWREGECVEARVRVGAGYIAFPCGYWTERFIRYAGWTGADGVYSMQCGEDVLFSFGDTFVSNIDAQSHARVGEIYMPNNTMALLKKDGEMAFFVNRAADGRPVAMVAPEDPANYYWLQDGLVLDGYYYTLASVITNDESGPEGFKFRLLGVDLVKAPIQGGIPDFARVIRRKTPLCAYGMLFGSAFLVDGEYIYIYGYRDTDFARELLVARVEKQNFENIETWEFFDGREFCPDMRRAVGVLQHVSCEMSVTRMGEKRYLAVFQYDTNSRYVAYALATSPWGPFGAPHKVYEATEGQLCASAYVYNAKAHPLLSYNGGLVCSYNVNATSFEDHIKNGHLYRPRFIELRDTTLGALGELFASAYEDRVQLFRELNRTARKGQSVFVGDSITQEFPVEELLGEGYLNRGIGADTSAGVLRRLEESVFAFEPRAVYLMIGTNDAPMGISAEETVENIRQIVSSIRERLPQCKVHIISILPVAVSQHPKVAQGALVNRDNGRIAEVNRQICGMGDSFVDAYHAMLDANGGLALPYTRDGLHLNGNGYRKLLEILGLRGME